MATRRTIRVSEIIRKELSQLILRTRTLEGHLVTISSVETSPDMRNAFVYISVLSPDGPSDKVMGELVKHRHIWQRAIGQHLRSKFTPALQFRFDKSIERGDRIMEILTDLQLPIGKQVPGLEEDVNAEVMGEDELEPQASTHDEPEADESDDEETGNDKRR